MSDHHDYLRTETDRSFRLSADILALMLRGAGYAAVACLVLWFSIAAIQWVGTWLPEDSRETPDPTPFSFYLNEESHPSA